ncbi:hypothetical protein [Pleomorphomonas sp. JP5]|uniref:hypothetical protein n=1 Tax=Pleomorphomonas sp. JP5 TaxID=2942998 RepID=UPI0020431E36|nr:hypothetical protein [Pleomorphomonas sp. JP5]MCM5557280.1 hypothetical protein [Pleomorphomonas sp. JP5]
MKRSAAKPSSRIASSTIVLGRSAFNKISAVEGIKLSPSSERMFADFDQQGLTAEQRRLALLKKHAKKA